MIPKELEGQLSGVYCKVENLDELSKIYELAHGLDLIEPSYSSFETWANGIGDDDPIISGCSVICLGSAIHKESRGRFINGHCGFPPAHRTFISVDEFCRIMESFLRPAEAVPVSAGSMDEF